MYRYNRDMLLGHMDTLYGLMTSCWHAFAALSSLSPLRCALFYNFYSLIVACWCTLPDLEGQQYGDPRSKSLASKWQTHKSSRVGSW
jgi:hypothetical protein